MKQIIPVGNTYRKQQIWAYKNNKGILYSKTKFFFEKVILQSGQKYEDIAKYHHYNVM